MRHSYRYQCYDVTVTIQVRPCEMPINQESKVLEVSLYVAIFISNCDFVKAHEL